MKKYLPLLILLFLPFLWCVVCPALDSNTKNWNFIALNFPKKEPEFKLPKGYKLLFNQNTKEYEVIIPDAKWSTL